MCLSVHLLKKTNNPEFLGQFVNCRDLIDYGGVGCIMQPTQREMAAGPGGSTETFTRDQLPENKGLNLA